MGWESVLIVGHFWKFLEPIGQVGSFEMDGTGLDWNPTRLVINLF